MHTSWRNTAFAFPYITLVRPCMCTGVCVYYVIGTRPQSRTLLRKQNPTVVGFSWHCSNSRRNTLFRKRKRKTVKILTHEAVDKHPITEGTAPIAICKRRNPSGIPKIWLWLESLNNPLLQLTFCEIRRCAVDCQRGCSASHAGTLAGRDCLNP